MFLASVVYILIAIIIGVTFADEEPKVTVKHFESDEGTAGYDLFFYDGESLRDEKWRFDPKTGSAVVSRRNGFREKDDFHLVDATLDALGSFTKSYKMRNGADLLKRRVKEPQMNKEGDEAVKAASNGFSGLSINTQYSSQNGYPHVSNIVGIQQLNAPNLYNGLNFQQAFTTAGFGFQQHGSLFNHQTQFQLNPSVTFPNNHNFQLSSFLMPFFNQNNNSPNQHQTFGSFPSFGTLSQGGGYVTEQPPSSTTVANTENTSDTSSTPVPIAIEESTTTTTTPDPTLNFDVRFEKDKNVETSTETQVIQTASRRPIEGLPASDEESPIGGVLDDRINPQVLKTLVG